MTAAPCPPWCVADHSDDIDSGTHMSEFYDDPLTLHKPYEGVDGRSHPDHFVAVAVQPEDEREPQVHVGTTDPLPVLVLRPDEAAALGFWLIETAGAIKAHQETT